MQSSDLVNKRVATPSASGIYRRNQFSQASSMLLKIFFFSSSPFTPVLLFSLSLFLFIFTIIYDLVSLHSLSVELHWCCGSV